MPLIRFLINTHIYGALRLKDGPDVDIPLHLAQDAIDKGFAINVGEGTLDSQTVGGSTPSGTGFRHVTSGTEDGTARAIDATGPDVTGLAAVALSGSASDLGSGTVAAARLPVTYPVSAGLANQGYQGITVSLTYAASLAPGNSVYVNSSGNVDKANATDNTKLCAGLAVETASSGAHIVLLSGIYRDDSLFSFSTLGGLVYLSTTAGLLTQTQPSATDNAIQVVGVALAAHVLYVFPQLTYATHI